jgi:CP family cyanate transporter-like MFS transporter
LASAPGITTLPHGLAHHAKASGLLWLAGFGLRTTVLAVAPVIVLIQSDLRLSGTEIGLLSGLPMVLFAIAALPGSFLITRCGLVWTLAIGAASAGVFSSLRGAGGALVLYAMTVAMSAGIAVMQPALPPLVRQWLPNRIGFGTALYMNGLLVGEVLAVALTPLLLPHFGCSWRCALWVWGAPLCFISLAILLLAPPTSESRAPVNWRPDWRDRRIWQGGLIIGSINSVFFAANAFLPGYLTHAGRPYLINGALAALNIGPLAASLLLLLVADRLGRRGWPFVLSGAVMLLCLIGIVASSWVIVCAGILGFAGAVVFTLGFALPALLAAPHEVPCLAAAMFTVSYAEAVLCSVLAGAAWDAGESPRWAFLPMVLVTLPLLFLPAKLFPLSRGARAAAPKKETPEWLHLLD